MFTKGNHMSNKFLLILIMLTLSACFPAMVIKDTITKYESVKSQIELGDSKQKVLSILNPTQKDLQFDWKKRPENTEDRLAKIKYRRDS